MFDTLKDVAGTVGSVFRSLPAAARISSDLEAGRRPNDNDLRILNLPIDNNY